jgi:hypothetical protein
MSQEFHATYEHGILRLDMPLALPEQTRVSGIVSSAESAAAPSIAEDSTSSEEFERILDELAMPLGGTLPADFSREDVYFDHD